MRERSGRWRGDCSVETCPPTGVFLVLNLRPTRRATLRVHPSVGILRLPPVPYAARGLPPLWRRGRGRSSLGQWQTYADQSLHVVSGPLGAPAFVARHRRGVSHFLG